MYELLLLLAALAAIAGFLLSQDAFFVAITLALLARIVQANKHQKELLAALGLEIAEKEAKSPTRAVDRDLRQLARERGIE